MALNWTWTFSNPAVITVSRDIYDDPALFVKDRTAGDMSSITEDDFPMATFLNSPTDGMPIRLNGQFYWHPLDPLLDQEDEMNTLRLLGVTGETVILLNVTADSLIAQSKRKLEEAIEVNSNTDIQATQSEFGIIIIDNKGNIVDPISLLVVTPEREDGQEVYDQPKLNYLDASDNIIATQDNLPSPSYAVPQPQPIPADQGNTQAPTANLDISVQQGPRPTSQQSGPTPEEANQQIVNDVVNAFPFSPKEKVSQRVKKRRENEDGTGTF